MREYITLGPTPCDEPCAQVGTDDYEERALRECVRYREQLLKTFGPPPEGGRLSVKSFPHDMGSYHELVVWYDSDVEATVDYAFRVENNLPANWEG